MPAAVSAKPWTEAAAALAAAGIDGADREARLLWAAALGVSSGDLWLRDASPTPDQAMRVAAWVVRRAAGEPLAYVMGSMAFRHLHLVVDRRVLIPRPETEGIVDHVLAWGRTRPGSWGRALDLGTGSGCLAIALATEGRFASVTATDVDADALAVAAVNVASCASGAVTLERGPWFQPVAGEQFAVIVSNPPYITEREYAELDRSVRLFEPRAALVSGTDGLAATRTVLEEASDRLAPDGVLVLEVDTTRAEQALALARACKWVARIEPDLFDRPRYLIATKDKG